MNIWKKLIISHVLMIVFLLSNYAGVAYADDAGVDVKGKVYSVLGTDYDYLSSDEYDETDPGVNTYGSFHIDGDIRSFDEKNGFEAFIVDGDHVDFYYGLWCLAPPFHFYPALSVSGSIFGLKKGGITAAPSARKNHVIR